MFLAQPILWGLTFDGQKGAEDVFGIVVNEFDNTMALAGKILKYNFISYWVSTKMLDDFRLCVIRPNWEEYGGTQISIFKTLNILSYGLYTCTFFFYTNGFN